MAGPPVRRRGGWLRPAVVAGLGAAMLYLILTSLGRVMRLGAPDWAAPALAAGTLAAGWGLWCSRWTRWALLALAGLGLAAATWTVPGFWATVRSLWERSVETVWLFRRGALYRLDPDVAWGFWTAAAAGGSLVLAYFLFRRRDAFWLLVLGTALFTGQWLYYLDAALRYALAWLVLGLLAHGTLALGRRPDPLPVSAAGLVWGLVLLFAVGAAAAALPSDFEPVSLGALEDVVLEWFPFIGDMRGGGTGGAGLQYTIAASGFGRSARELGGPVLLDHGETLEVEIRVPQGPVILSGPALAVDPAAATSPERWLADRTLSQSIYLRGVAKETYTGRGWLDATRDYRTRPAGEPLVPGYGSDVPALELELIVTPLRLRTSTVFTLLAPVALDLPAEEYLHDPSLSVVTPEVIHPGQSYTVRSRVALVSLEHLRQLAAAAVFGDAVAPGEAQDDGRWRQGFVTYLQLPSDLPARVRELAGRVAAGLDNPVDQALAVEAFLRQFPYRLDPPATPPDRDFVDYFLFDLQEGYCVYYASAMVVMLRSLGIPARWVEGFILPRPWGTILGPGATPPGPRGRTPVAPRPDTLRATVRSSNAHAWVEAYMPGFGWVVFEPTPAYPAPPRDLPAPPAVGAAAPGPPAGAGGGPPAPPVIVGDDVLERGLEAGEVVAGGMSARRVLAAAGRALLGLLLAVGLGGAAWRAHRSLRLERPDRANPEGSVRRLYARARQLVHRTRLGGEPGLPWGHPGDTPAEVTARVLGRDAEMGRAFRELSRVYESVRYGPGPAGPADLDRALRAWQAFLKSLVAARGSVAAWWLRLT